MDIVRMLRDQLTGVADAAVMAMIDSVHDPDQLHEVITTQGVAQLPTRQPPRAAGGAGSAGVAQGLGVPHPSPSSADVQAVEDACRRAEQMLM